VGFDYKGSASDPDKQAESDTTQTSSAQKNDPYQSRLIENLSAEELEPKYREHVSGHLRVPPVAAAKPAYPPQQQPQRTQQTPATAYQPPARPQYPQPRPPVGPQYPQYGQPSGQPYGYGTPQSVGPYGAYPQQYQGQPYPGNTYNPYYNNYAPGYNGYVPYPYGYQPYGNYGWPARPKRDAYQLTIAIITLVCSVISGFIGLFCALILVLTTFVSSAASKPEDTFSSITLFTALTIAGLGGGTLGTYHSIRALLKKKSFEFKLPSLRLGTIRLPWFVIFLALYVVIIAIGLMIRGNVQIVDMTWLTILMIELAGLLPALTVLTLGVWRVHRIGDVHWPTTWRRLSVALVSGATSAILFAMILEGLLGYAIQEVLQINNYSLTSNNLPSSTSEIIYLFLVVSVLAPFVEEGVKPLAVISMIGRIGSAGEAFILGMACGIGFDLIETSGYIGMGYSNWVDVAIERSSAGLLHSFGAGMTALGWYIITHRKSVAHRRILIGIGCCVYAILQHAIWNATFLFQLLPAPIGPYLNNGVINIGSYPLPSILIISAVETILMIIFFLFVTGKLSGKRTFWRPRQNNGRQFNLQRTDEATRQPTTHQTDPLPAR
jgi:RsiW-degrading membrane proteinase PrsW (M82 family)